MRRIALTLLLALLPTLGWGQTTQTINPIPVSGSTFLPVLQTFLRDEDANRYNLMFRGFTSAGGTHGTVAGLTGTPSPWTGFPKGYYTTDTGSILYPNASTCWVIASSTTSGNLATFARVTGTHYLTDCATPTQPVTPAGSTYLMKVVTAAGAITAVTDLRSLTPLDGATFSGLSVVAPGAAYPAFTLASDWQVAPLQIVKGSAAVPTANEEPAVLAAMTGTPSTPGFGHGGTSALVAAVRSEGTAVTGAIFAGDFYMEGNATGSAATMFQGALHSTTVSMRNGAPIWGAWFQAKQNGKASPANGVEINTNCDDPTRSLPGGGGTSTCIGQQNINYGTSTPADGAGTFLNDIGFYSSGYGRMFVGAAVHYVPSFEVMATGRTGIGSVSDAISMLVVNDGIGTTSTEQLKVIGVVSSAGANIRLQGNGGTTPNKYIRSKSGAFEVVNNAYSNVLMQLTDAGAMNVLGGYSSGGVAGVTSTATVCASGACATTCTLIFTGGIRTGGTC